MNKYKLLNESLKAIKEGVINLLVLKGEAGFGKTFTTLKYCRENEIKHKYVNTYTTPLSFYKLLYENRESEVLVFDDLSSISDPTIKAMLKAICEGEETKERVINYYSTSSILEKEGLPESFEFKPKVVLIFNQSPAGFESIINRGVEIEFNFTFKQKLLIFNHFQAEADISQVILDYLKTDCNASTQNLSIRSLVILSKLHQKGYDWELFAKEILKKDEDLNALIVSSVTDWCHSTGLSRRTYYRQRKKNGLRNSAKVPQVPPRVIIKEKVEK